MIGLTQLPSQEQLGAAYQRLQDPQAQITLEQWALWSQWSRLDPRLAEQWITAISQQWRSIPPAQLNGALQKQPWPAAAGVLLEQGHGFYQASKTERRLYLRWCRCVMSDVRPACDEQYFMGMRAFAGEAMRQDAALALRPYRRWGYLGREILRNKASQGLLTGRGLTWAPPALRRQVLEALLRTRPRITIQDYRAALGGAVGRRQAELDVAQYNGLRAVGKTRNRIYVVGNRAGVKRKS